MGDDELSEHNVKRLLRDVTSNEAQVRDRTAAALSKVAAKAEGEASPFDAAWHGLRLCAWPICI